MAALAPLSRETICPGHSGDCSPADNPNLTVALSHWWGARRWDGKVEAHGSALERSRDHRSRGVLGFRCHCNSSAHIERYGYFCGQSSHHAVDVFLATLVSLLSNKSDGLFFVEIGGNDGRETSNSVFLESCLGWRGLLVEPEPNSFERLRHNRPGALSIRVALCASHGTTATFLRRRDGLPNGAQLLAERRNSSPGLATFRPARWLFDPSIVEPVQVPCSGLGSLFARLGIGRVDVFFLDVEGDEALVLSTIDWRAVSIGALSVEFTRVDHAKNREVVRLLRAAGFRLVACVAVWRANIYDVVFLRPEHFGIVSTAPSWHWPPAVDARLRDHHRGSAHHDPLRCPHDRLADVSNQTFQILPPLV